MTGPRRRDGFGLTARQRELLAYIQTRELCPSFEEMRRALRLSTNSGVHRLLTGLEERGYIRRLSGRARAIQVMRPIRGGLCVVFDSEHFAMRAAEKRRLWAIAERGRG